MAKILLTLYAERHKKSQSAVTRMANRGSFNTAEKIGRQWFIEEDEEYPDNRVKHGKYIDIKNKRSRKNEMSGKYVGLYNERENKRNAKMKEQKEEN